MEWKLEELSEAVPVDTVQPSEPLRKLVQLEEDRKVKQDDKRLSSSRFHKALDTHLTDVVYGKREGRSDRPTSKAVIFILRHGQVL